MTREDIDNIISIICPNDEDFEKACISPAYLKKELESLALEQESCEEAISRRVLLDTIDRFCDLGKRQLKEIIKDMALVNAEPIRWIPCNERLPKIADVYRVTRYYPNNVMNPKYLVDACAFDGSTWYNDNRINHERDHADNVIAWQENPEPYKAESEGSDEDCD